MWRQMTGNPSTIFTCADTSQERDEQVIVQRGRRRDRIENSCSATTKATFSMESIRLGLLKNDHL